MFLTIILLYCKVLNLLRKPVVCLPLTLFIGYSFANTTRYCNIFFALFLIFLEFSLFLAIFYKLEKKHKVLINLFCFKKIIL